MTQEFREEAEKHWQVIETLLKNYTEEENKTTVSMACCRLLYIEAMVHGYKHAKQDFIAQQTKSEKP
jgi:hypothetical protein